MNHPITINTQEKMENFHSIKNAIGKEHLRMLKLFALLLFICMLLFIIWLLHEKHSLFGGLVFEKEKKQYF